MELKEIENASRKVGVPLIRTKSHEILKNIVKETYPKHILEIGTAVGYSGITMLESTSADLITIEHEKTLCKLAKQNFKNAGFKNRVSLIEGDCMVALAKMLASKKYDNYFDFIFLDGPKAQYDLMLEMLLIMLAPNGTFVADNVLFRGYVEGQTKPPTKRYKTIVKRLNTFIENCKNNPKLTNFKLIDTEDGIIFAKKVQKWKTEKLNF